jgi:hypothetical protein
VPFTVSTHNCGRPTGFDGQETALKAEKDGPKLASRRLEHPCRMLEIGETNLKTVVHSYPVSNLDLRHGLINRPCATFRLYPSGTHRSTVQLEQAIRHYRAIHNESPQPFVWTKTADDIFESIARFCKRISDSGH